MNRTRSTCAAPATIEKKLNGIPHVTGVTYCSPACAKKDLLSRLHGDLQGSISELNQNPLPPSFDLNLDDPDNLETVRAELVPPGAKGEPAPISPIIEEVKDSREEASDIRAVKLSYFLAFAAAAALLPFASLYYKQLGYGAGAIGWLVGLPLLVNVLAAPVWGAIADATRRHRLVLCAAVSAAGLLAGAMAAASSLALLLLGVGIWGALLESGVDPVITGLAVGLVTTAFPAQRSDLERVTTLTRLFREQPTSELAQSAREGVRSAI